MKKSEQKKYPRWFNLILWAIPVVILIILEIFLRIINYGTDRRQWVDAGNNQVTLNYQIAQRYFHSYENAPVVLSANFDKEKKNNAFRVFVIGASSAAGFPYLPNGSFSNYIEDRLKLIYPNIPIEVINCGITATNTYAWLDLLPGIIEKKPDLILFYGGHNEYYGALGVASTESFGSARWIIKLSLCLDNFKITELVRNTVKWISALFNSNAGTREKASTLMAKLAKGQYVVYDSELFKEGINQFEDNLREILKLSKRNNIPVILGMLVSNLKDQPPFVSKQSGSVPPAQKYFELAKSKLKKGNLKEADSLFRLAKDLDLLKFRAPEAFNTVIRKLSEEFNYPVADMDSLFSHECRNNIIGNELITDHLHPTLKGYQLMGKQFFKVMQEKNFLPHVKPSDISNVMQDSIVLANYNFSALDSLIAVDRITILRNDWPFVENNFSQHYEEIKLNNFTDSLANLVANGFFGWGDAHMITANKFLAEGNINSYKKEMNILINTFTNKTEYYDQLIMVLMNNNLFAEAYPLLLKRYKILSDAFSSKWLGYINFLNKNNNAAIYYFEKSIAFNASDPDIYFYLTGAYGKEEKFNEALKSIQKCLELAPNYPRGKAVLQIAQDEVNKRSTVP